MRYAFGYQRDKPESSGAHNILGMILVKQGDWNGAAAGFERSLEIKRDSNGQRKIAKNKGNAWRELAKISGMNGQSH